MYSVSDIALKQLCDRLQINPEFVVQCLQESVVEIHEIDGRLDLGNGTILRLRQLERICVALNVDVSGAVLLLKLTQRVAELEEEVRLLREGQL